MRAATSRLDEPSGGEALVATAPLALGWMVIALGLAALAARSVGAAAPLVAAAVGAAALVADAGPRLRTARSLSAWAAVTAAGIAVFAAGRALAPLPAAPVTAAGAAGAIIAAVAEEAFFRRLLYGRLERWGAGLAVGASALAFAAVHVPLWGWHTAPLNLAAGLVLGWQRHQSGGWTAPAATHAAANLLAMAG